MNTKLALLYLASPTLPIGSFAYSQGLETAIDKEIVTDRDSLQKWCYDTIKFGLTQLDLVLLSQIRSAIDEGDQAKVNALNEQVFASRETSELCSEEVNLGQSLARLLKTQECLNNDLHLPKTPSFLTAFAACAASLGLSIDDMAIAFLWSWLENQTAVACKAIPLGQTDAQHVLLSLTTLISDCANDIPCQAFGSMPGQAILSMMHETQYSRLFRS